MSKRTGRDTRPRWKCPQSTWTVLTFSLPDWPNAARGALRNKLRALGFALLHDGIRISPRDLSQPAAALPDELEAPDGHVLRATHVPRGTGETPLRSIYDLDSLDQAYRDFLGAHRPAATRAPTGNPLVYRTQLMSEWLAFRDRDPELPEELLPEQWARPSAYALFIGLYDRLGPGAEARFGEVLARVDSSLAQVQGPSLSREGRRDRTHHVRGHDVSGDRHEAAPDGQARRDQR
ncbi:DNA-binding transcriptional regulator PaaX [Amycolatopsis endophytica]|uniref:DNA-binding transcriptional regulator PaaX n=1 Tax=Amycolatopsis endophytica TaxID=860233 RepID=A0A853B8Q6_9PSEU|nr:PaaX family transcriptional regulator C-terminal domain-containing protein [Amycolatopsis endophytica]NYI91693.1 DNA-binding transcriptional regulator PaaX [Amycolatopsis endophytica]